MELQDQMMRVKVRLMGAYERLHQQGILSEAELEEALAVVGAVEEGIPVPEIRRRLAALGRSRSQAAAEGDGERKPS